MFSLSFFIWIVIRLGFWLIDLVSKVRRAFFLNSLSTWVVMNRFGITHSTELLKKCAGLVYTFVFFRRGGKAKFSSFFSSLVIHCWSICCLLCVYIEWILGQRWMVFPFVSTLRRFGYGASLSLQEDGSLSGFDCREVRAC